MKYLCRMVTPKDGTVLDPFMGSGSTGMAAKYEEFDFIGIEREKEYFEIATLRIDSVEVPSTLEKFL
jgi:site-specific DNA-methyltransferase (adenine-specific)